MLRREIARAFAAGMLWWSAGCSLVVDSSLNGLKCSSATGGAQCLPGYSCQGEECVADGSVKEGETCSNVKQCVTGLVCPMDVFVCGRPCNKLFEVVNDCDADHACVPAPDEATNGRSFKGGVCVAIECSGTGADDECKNVEGTLSAPNGSNRCIRAAENGGLCMPACVVGKRRADDPAGPDQCATDKHDNPLHCGRVPSGDFVCLPAGAASDGSRCTLFPQSQGTVSDDACATGAPGLPLLCLNAKGSADAAMGERRCRRSACDPNVSAGTPNSCPQNPTPQVCDEELGLRFCKGLTE